MYANSIHQIIPPPPPPPTHTHTHTHPPPPPPTPTPTHQKVIMLIAGIISLSLLMFLFMFAWLCLRHVFENFISTHRHKMTPVFKYLCSTRDGQWVNAEPNTVQPAGQSSQCYANLTVHLAISLRLSGWVLWPNMYIGMEYNKRWGRQSFVLGLWTAWWSWALVCWWHKQGSFYACTQPMRDDVTL